MSRLQTSVGLWNVALHSELYADWLVVDKPRPLGTQVSRLQTSVGLCHVTVHYVDGLACDIVLETGAASSQKKLLIGCIGTPCVFLLSLLFTLPLLFKEDTKVVG